MNCPKCGLAVDGASNFCNHCGAPLNEQGRTLNIGATAGGSRGVAPATSSELDGMTTATEKTLWDEYPSLRTAWVPMVLVLVLYVIAMVLVYFLISPAGRPRVIGLDAITWGITLLTAVVLLFMLLRNLIRLRSVRYKLTSQRIFVTYGILNKRTDEIELEKYKDVFVNQDFWDKIVGCGDIQIVTGDVTNPTVNILDVIDPMSKKESIRNAARERQAKLGLRLQQEM